MIPFPQIPLHARAGRRAVDVHQVRERNVKLNQDNEIRCGRANHLEVEERDVSGRECVCVCVFVYFRV